MSGLFRIEALTARQPKWLGEIIVMQPPSARLFALLAGAMLVGLTLVLTFGSYTRRTVVVGRLMPANGLIQVSAHQNGIIAERRFVEGEMLQEGQVMYVISGERQSSVQANMQLTISRELALRQQSLQTELEMKQSSLRDLERRAGRALSQLQDELSKTDEQLAAQDRRLDLENQSQQRFQDLHNKGYVSGEGYKQKQADLYEQQSRRVTLQRERLAVLRRIDEKQDEFVEIKARFVSDIAVLARQLSASKQELGESEFRRSEVIIAPRAGIATNIMADTGQAVAAGSRLASIVPRDALLQARLYAPSKALGFIRAGESVMLRYQAFPYQFFGQAKGHVISVSQAPVRQTELDSGSTAATEDRYEVIVALEKQFIVVDGRQRQLPPGMLLEADVLSENRQLYQWMFVPFQTLNNIAATH